MAGEIGPIVEPYEVGVLDMVTHMLRAQLSVGSIAPSRKPVQPVSRQGIMVRRLEQRVVRAVVDQVGGDDHAVRQRDTTDHHQNGFQRQDERGAAKIGCVAIDQRRHARDQAALVAEIRIFNSAEHDLSFPLSLIPYASGAAVNERIAKPAILPFLHIRHQPHPRMAYGDGRIDTGDTCNNTCKIMINKDV